MTAQVITAWAQSWELLAGMLLMVVLSCTGGVMHEPGRTMPALSMPTPCP